MATESRGPSESPHFDEDYVQSGGNLGIPCEAKLLPGLRKALKWVGCLSLIPRRPKYNESFPMLQEETVLVLAQKSGLKSSDSLLGLSVAQSTQKLKLNLLGPGLQMDLKGETKRSKGRFALGKRYGSPYLSDSIPPPARGSSRRRSGYRRPTRPSPPTRSPEARGEPVLRIGQDSVAESAPLLKVTNF